MINNLPVTPINGIDFNCQDLGTKSTFIIRLLFWDNPRWKNTDLLINELGHVFCEDFTSAVIGSPIALVLECISME